MSLGGVKMSEKKEQAVLELVSPSGHKYEITVSDAGTLITTLKSK